jgi:hypothetical protein
MSNVVPLDKSGTYDCLLLSVGRIRPLNAGTVDDGYRQGPGESTPQPGPCLDGLPSASM